MHAFGQGPVGRPLLIFILAALALMRISFAVQDAEEKAGKKVHKEPQNTVKSRKKVG